MKMKKGHELKIRERLSKSYLQVIFIAVSLQSLALLHCWL